MLLGLSSVFLGKSFWNFPLLHFQLFKITISMIFLFVSMILNLLIVASFLMSTYKKIDDKANFVLKLVPIGTIIVGGAFLITDKAIDQTQLIIGIISSAFQILTIKTIIYSQAHQRIPMFNFECIMVFTLAVLTQNKFFHESFVHLILRLGFFCLVSMEILVISSVLQQLKEKLGVNYLTVGNKKIN